MSPSPNVGSPPPKGGRVQGRPQRVPFIGPAWPQATSAQAGGNQAWREFQTWRATAEHIPRCLSSHDTSMDPMMAGFRLAGEGGHCVIRPSIRDMQTGNHRHIRRTRKEGRREPTPADRSLNAWPARLAGPPPGPPTSHTLGQRA